MVRYLIGLLLGLSYFQSGIGNESSIGTLLDSGQNNFTTLEEDVSFIHRGCIVHIIYEGSTAELAEQYHHDFQLYEIEIQNVDLLPDQDFQDNYNPQACESINPHPADNIDGANITMSDLDNSPTYDLHFVLFDELNENQIAGLGDNFYQESEQACDKATQDSSETPSIPANSSYFYEIGSEDLINGGIGFINGIKNNEGEAKKHALRISRYAQGAKIFGVYNATHSVILDIVECILGQCRISMPPVEILKKQWAHFISTRGPNTKFLQICHSSGTIYVFNALASSPKEIRERIIVLAISPGAVIPKKLCFEAYNYASKRDVIPHLDAIGKILYGDQLILLDPHPESPHFDHGFDSPTFQDIILYHITNYLKQIGYIK